MVHDMSDLPVDGFWPRSKDSALCPEIFASSWGLRKEHYTGAAVCPAPDLKG